MVHLFSIGRGLFQLRRGRQSTAEKPLIPISLIQCIWVGSFSRGRVESWIWLSAGGVPAGIRRSGFCSPLYPQQFCRWSRRWRKARAFPEGLGFPPEARAPGRQIQMDRHPGPGHGTLPVGGPLFMQISHYLSQVRHLTISVIKHFGALRSAALSGGAKHA